MRRGGGGRGADLAEGVELRFRRDQQTLHAVRVPHRTRRGSEACTTVYYQLRCSSWRVGAERAPERSALQSMHRAICFVCMGS